MSENPFKIIRPTDQPPKDLRKEVMGSAKFVMLLMRFVLLFLADLSASVFDSVRLVGPREKRDGTNNATPKDDL